MTQNTTKKPKWTVISFDQIENVREEIGLSKSAMAEAIGITNSTFHNWRRGKTIPHLSQQEEIANILDTLLTSGDASSSDTAGAPTTEQPTVQTPPVTDPKASGNEGGGSNLNASDLSVEHPLYPNRLTSVTGSLTPTANGPEIAAITAAWIKSQGALTPSAGSVYDFITGLKAVL